VADALQIEWPEDPESRLSVIIPTRDSADMVFALISSLRRHAAAWERVEAIVIVNGEPEPPLRSAFTEIQNTFEQVKVAYYPIEFNWAYINNYAVRDHATAELLLFMNDDMICLSHDWDRRVRSQLSRDELGVIGGRLLYPNGAIQHAGIAFGQGAMTAHEGMGDDAADGLYLDRTLLVHEVGAVTGALLGCRRNLFDSLGGFDAERYMVTSSDADFCVRTRLAGKAVIYDPFLTWIHYESASRGSDTYNHKRQWRAEAEHERWRSRFSERDLIDLSVNPHLARSRRPFETFHRLTQQEITAWLEAQVRQCHSAE
jgi:GT2 family glycosyltransferase